MVERVKAITETDKTRLYENKKVYKNTKPTLKDLFSSKYSQDEFESILLNWSLDRLEIQLKVPIFSIDMQKLDFLYRLVLVNGMQMPVWLFNYFS